MKYITITADTYDEALRKARAQYGGRLRIHSRKDTFTKGFFGIGRKPVCELTCFTSDIESPVEHEPEQVQYDSSEIKRYEKEAMTPDPSTGMYSQNIDTSDEVVSVVQDNSEIQVTPQQEIKHIFVKPFDLNDESTMTIDARSDYEIAKENVDENSEQSTQKSYTDVEKSAGESVIVNAAERKAACEEVVCQIKELLKMNDFSDDYSEMAVLSVKKSIEDAYPAIPDRKTLELLLLDLIIGSISIDVQSQLSMPRYFVIVGPTGIGKTTTIAKIAAVYGTLPEVQDRKKVRIITLDSFRIGAYEQMEAFGNNLGIPVMRADDRRSFEDALSSCSDADLILVDTIGKSPHDIELDARLRNLLHVLPDSQTGFYLGINASMKTRDIEMAYSIFKGLDLSGAVITKTDETETIGNILSVCWKRHLPIIFITDGQKVPSCIHQATNEYIMSLLKGFTDVSGSVMESVGTDVRRQL